MDLVLDALLRGTMKMIFALGRVATDRVLARDRREPRETDAPSELMIRLATSEYREWAESKGLSWTEKDRAWKGHLGSTEVVVHPGLRETRAYDVLAQIALAHGRRDRQVFARGAERAGGSDEPDDVGRAFAAIYDGEPHLRAIVIIPGGATLRFAPMTPPRLVEAAIAEVAKVFASQVSEATTPYR